MADEERTILIDVEVENKDFDKEIGNVNKELQENQRLIKELKKDYSENSAEIARLEAKNRDLSNSKRQLIKESQTEINSLNALRLKLANLTKERNNTNTSTKEGATRFKELQKEIKGTSDEIKGFEEEGGDFRRSIGDYVSETKIFGVSLTDLTNSLTSVLGAIAAITAGAVALFKAYASSARGTNDLARASDRLDSILNNLGNSLADISGEGNFFDDILRRLQISVFGLSNAIKSELIVNLKEELRELEIEAIQVERNTKIQLDSAEKLRQVRDEERNSIEDRRFANIELFNVIDKREKEAVTFLEKRLGVLQLLLGFDKENLEIRKEIAQVEFDIADRQEEAQGFRSEAFANDLALNKELVEDRIALTELQIASEIQKTEEGTKERLDLEIKLIKKRQELELIAAGENISRRKVAIQKALNDEFELRKTFLEKTESLEDEELRKVKEAAENLEIFRLEEDERLIESEERKREILLENQGLLEDERFLIIERSEAKISDIREKAEAKISATRKKAGKAEAVLNKNLKDAKIKNEQETLNGLITIFGQASLVGKAFALTQIGYDTAQAISALTKASEGNPANAFTFGGAGLAQFIAGMARIAINIAKAKQVLSSSGASTGSLSSSTGGGSFASAQSSAQIDPGLSNVNASLLSQFGDQARTNANNNQDIVSGVSNLAAPQVSVEDINRVSNRVAVKEGEASLTG